MVTGQEPAGMVVLIAYNTGMASGDDALKASWAADLHTILSRGWLAVFTCASDHTDLVRESCLSAPVGPPSRGFVYLGLRHAIWQVSANS